MATFIRLYRGLTGKNSGASPAYTGLMPDLMRL